MKKASERQVGGDHYTKYKVQPWQVWDACQVGRDASHAIKYILRDKDPLLDLPKALHYVDKMIEAERRLSNEAATVLMCACSERDMTYDAARALELLAAPSPRRLAELQAARNCLVSAIAGQRMARYAPTK